MDGNGIFSVLLGLILIVVLVCFLGWAVGKANDHADAQQNWREQCFAAQGIPHTTNDINVCMPRGVVPINLRKE